ncbi:MAG: methyl-accepting chemotaxis protein [Roseburia sp.]
MEANKKMNAKERYTVKLENRSLKKTLTMTFGGLIVAALVVLLLSYSGMQLTNYMFQRLTNGPLTLNTQANRIQSQINDLEDLAYDAVLGNLDAASYQETSSSLITEIQSDLSDFENAVNDLNDATTSSGILPCISKMQSAITDYSDYAEYLGSLIADGDFEKASDTFRDYNEQASSVIDDSMSEIKSVLEYKQELYVARTNGIVLFSSILTIVAAISAVVMGTLIVKAVSRFILSSVNQIVDGLTSVAQGNLQTHIELKGDNEFVLLSNALNETISNIHLYIAKENEALAQMAERDMTAKIDTEFVGDFAPMKDAVNDITSKYNDFLLSSQNAADDVSGAADSMASISQTLATSSTEQAASVEELLATIETLNDSVKKVADSAVDMSNASKQNNEQVHTGNEKMQELLTAMNHIEETSREISGIIGMIDQIANQTNLLSLNASIEAARAGEHGRGFAVVAEEIRTLSEASSDAAHKISALIDTSLSAVDNGAAITRNTAELFENIVKNGETHVAMTEAISHDCASQSMTLQNVLSGVQEISATVENNSQLAEEASATSQELLASAESMASELQLFKLR